MIQGRINIEKSNSVLSSKEKLHYHLILKAQTNTLETRQLDDTNEDIISGSPDLLLVKCRKN